MKKTIILLSAIFLYGCNSNPKNMKKLVVKNIDRSPLILMPAKFSAVLQSDSFAAECSMLSSLTDSILKSSEKYNLKIQYNKINSGTDDKKDLLFVEFKNVAANKWKLFAVRPSSVATIKASILHNNKVIHVIERTIGSGASFSACGRLEKIALSAGNFVAKWASKNSY